MPSSPPSDSANPSPPSVHCALSFGGKTRDFVVTRRLVVGRESDADLVIDDSRMSRAHCRLEPRENGLKVTDLGSSNGTSVGGQEISQRICAVGDVVDWGGAASLTVLKIEAPGASEASRRSRGAATPPAVPAGGPPQLPKRGGAAPPPSLARAKKSAAPVPPQRPAVAKPNRAAPPALDHAKAPSVRPRPAASASNGRASSAASEPRRSAGVERSARGPQQHQGSRPAQPKRSQAEPRAVATAPAKASIKPLIIMGTVLCAIVALVFVLRDDGTEAAKGLRRRAQSLASEGQHVEALKTYEEIVALHGATQVAQDVAPEITKLRTRLRANAAAREELSRLLTQTDKILLSELLDEVRLIANKHEESLSPEDIKEFEGRAREVCAERTRIWFLGVRSRVSGMLSSREYGLALSLLDDATASGRALPSVSSDVATLRARILADASQAFGDLKRDLMGLDAKQAMARIEKEEQRFAYTPHVGELKARHSLLAAGLEEEARKTVAAKSPKKTEDVAKPSAAEAAELLTALTAAEDLAGRRRYPAAARKFEQAVEVAPYSERARLRIRLERMQNLARVQNALIERMNAEPGAFRGIKIAKGVKGRVVDANTEKVKITMGPGAFIAWDWSRINAPRLKSLVIRAGLRGEASVWAAGLFLEMGDQKTALELLAKRFDVESNHRESVEQLASEARGFEERPAGGFFLHDGSLLTAAERDEAVLVAQLAKFSRQVKEAAPGQWTQAADQLQGLGERGSAALIAALRARSLALAKQSEELPLLSKRSLPAVRARLSAELEKRRKAALALIFDSKRYPYPYAPNQAEVQAEVDQLASKVSEVWETPSRILAPESESMTAFLADAKAVTERLSALGEKHDVAAELSRAWDSMIGMVSFDGANKGINQGWKEAQKHNDLVLAAGLMTKRERECYDATNRYRVMMGRRAVKADDRLVLCARGHSQEMSDLGYFAHNSPTAGRKSPGDRARLAGWGGSVSENIARGAQDGYSVTRQWCHSSGHHRNILGARWTTLGVGKAKETNFWTQNFAGGVARTPEAAKGEAK